MIHTVQRDYDVMKLYQCDVGIAREFPLHVKYLDERAIDMGGVARDMLSMFWESVYIKMFDGSTLLIPAVHHQVETEKFPFLGTIISHGYIACGFLPVKKAFPILATVLLGAIVILNYLVKLCHNLYMYRIGTCVTYFTDSDTTKMLILA